MCRCGRKAAISGTIVIGGWMAVPAVTGTNETLLWVCRGSLIGCTLREGRKKSQYAIQHLALRGPFPGRKRPCAGKTSGRSKPDCDQFLDQRPATHREHQVLLAARHVGDR